MFRFVILMLFKPLNVLRVISTPVLKKKVSGFTFPLRPTYPADPPNIVFLALGISHHPLNVDPNHST